MAKVTLKAVHRIAVGKPKGNGQLNYIEPGKNFAVEEDEARKLVKEGAATKVEAKAAPAKSDDDDGDDDKAAAEAARVARLAEAKEMGIKGLRKDAAMETIEAKIAEAKKAAEDDDGGDGEGEDLV